LFSSPISKTFVDLSIRESKSMQDESHPNATTSVSLSENDGDVNGGFPWRGPCDIMAGLQLSRKRERQQLPMAIGWRTAVPSWEIHRGKSIAVAFHKTPKAEHTASKAAYRTTTIQIANYSVLFTLQQE
jgi:hypothetical protein